MPNLQRPFISYGRYTARWTSAQKISHVKSAEKISVKSVFNKHFRQYHKKNESDCLECGRKFYTEFMLKNHIARSHTDVKCDICDKTVTKKGLSKHKQTHQDINFECEMCDNVYNRRDKLELLHQSGCTGADALELIHRS